MAELITAITAAKVRAARAAIQIEVDEACQRAGRDPGEVELLLAAKYVPIADSVELLQAGITLVGENRAQDLLAREEAYPAEFRFDFIGTLQSRKVKQIAAHVRLIHSVATDSVLAQLERHRTERTKILIEVNVAGEPGKAGVAPNDLDRFIERCPVPVVGLMTMPPLTDDAQKSRRWFAALREMAQFHGLPTLSMGTSQDFAVAIEEGATIIRIGARLLQ